jgi:ketosteroid isomerase-like protein
MARIDLAAGRRIVLDMKPTTRLAALAAAIALSVPAQAETVQCPDPATARAEVEQTIHDFFAALRVADKAPFAQLTTPSFYAFDVGQRFAGSTLGDAVFEALSDGVEINWNLGPMDTRVRCDVAWSQWENIGSVGTPPDVQTVRWLESAVLVHDGARWKLDFFHSQRAKAE